MNNLSHTLPLSGVRIADFGWMIAGPLTTRVLANFGAEVIRIESSTRIDEIRALGPRPDGNTSPNVAGVFNDCNTSKLSITIDLNTSDGLSIVKHLISISDIVSNNFRGDRMGKWGLDYDNLKTLKPDIIMLSMPMMGSDGPHQHYGGNGINIIAGAGISGITGFPKRAPVGTGSLYPDFSGNPNHAALAVLSALRYRNRTGKGQFIDLAQYESTISLLGSNILEYTVNGTIPQRPGNRSEYAAPHGVYRCAGHDRWCAIAVRNKDEWQGLQKTMATPNWIEDEKFQTFAGRKTYEDEMDHLIEGWTRTLPAELVMRRLQDNGVPAGVVQNSKDLLENDPGYREAHVRTLSHPEIEPITIHGEPISISGLTPRLQRAPLLGEHTEYVLKDVLGMEESDIDDLYVDGVLN